MRKKGGCAHIVADLCCYCCGFLDYYPNGGDEEVEYEIELERKCEWVVDFSYYSYTLATYMITSGLHELQHNLYDTALPGNKATNSSYHQNIYNEYETSGNIHYRDPANMNCEDCHTNRARYAYASGGKLVPRSEKDANTAFVPPCRQCHTQDTSYITHADESHKPLYDSSDLNEACIMCHTGIDKSMEFKRPEYLMFEIRDTNPATTGPPNNRERWELENFTTGPSDITQIRLTHDGNKHTRGSASDIDCFDCHSDVVDALKNGGHVPMSRDGADTPAMDAGYGCYIMCHSIMCDTASGEPWNAQQGNWAPFRHKNLTANMESLDGWCDYKTDKVCVACHIADGDFSPLAFPNDNGGLRITIYSEPGVKVDYTYY